MLKSAFVRRARHAEENSRPFSPSIAQDRLSKFAPFDQDWYRRCYADVRIAGVDPCQHWLKHGYSEGRAPYPNTTLAKAVGAVAQDGFIEDKPQEVPRAKGRRVGIACHSKSNEFMQDISKDLASGFRKLDVQVQMLSEMDDPQQPFDYKIIVAPHEFFNEPDKNSWNKEEILSSVYMLGTEQIQTKWFIDALPYMLAAKGVIDSYSHSMLLLRNSGIPAVHYVPDPDIGCVPYYPGYTSHPLFQALPKSVREAQDVTRPLADRPLDICYFGAESEHRDRTLARLAPVLARFDCCIYHRRLARGPISGASAALVSIASHVSAASRITLNLHRDYFGAFEWYRVVRLGMCAGSLVVSESGLPAPGFISGKHYLEADSRHLPELVEWLLTTDEGKRKSAQIQEAAFALLKDNFDKNYAAKRVMKFLLEQNS